MNEQQRKIFFQLLIDLFLDGKQEARSEQQKQGEKHEKVSTEERRRARKRNH